MTAHDAAAQPAPDTPTAPAQAAPVARVTPEALIYLLIALLALGMRVADLGRNPLDDAEARQALAAFRVVSADAPGAALVADSPLTYTFNVISFNLLGRGALAARLPVALGGVLLVLSPSLWRRYVNPLPPLITSFLLAISPVALLASRTMSPAVWSMLLAVVVPWLVLRFVEMGGPRWAAAATAGAAAMILLAEPAGALALLALGFGVIFAWLTDEDAPALAAWLVDVARRWPWAEGLVTAGIAIVIVGTGFYFLPSGLTGIGHALWTGLRGFAERTPGAPVAFPLLVGLRYETGLALFGLLAVYRAVRIGGFFERALAGWFLGGVVWSLGYAGATAGHALWLTVPLAALVGLAITGWLTERADFMWQVPPWSVTLHAVITFALWMAVGMSVILLGKRLLFDVPGGITRLETLVDALTDGIYSRNTQQPEWIEITDGVGVWGYVLGFIQLRLLLTALITLLIGVLYFLAGSLWGARTAWRGLALGTLAFLLVFSWGLGGRAAFEPPGDPREYWYLDPVTDDVGELRATLREMSLRDTGEPHLIAVTAQVPDDDAVAWALRDFPNLVYVDGVGPEVSTAAVLTPYTVPEPDLGGDYVGKDLVLRRRWDADTLSWKDGIMWFYRGDASFKPGPGETLMLWVRADVYGVEQVTED